MHYNEFDNGDFGVCLASVNIPGNLTWESSPIKMSIKKNRAVQNWGHGNRDNTVGNVWKTSPGPKMKFE